MGPPDAPDASSSDFKRRRRASAVLVATLVGAATALLAGAQHVNADTVASEAGHCVFAPGVATPPLTATFSPSLAKISGDGHCVVNAGYMEMVDIEVAGGGGLTCIGGSENMSGQITFSGVTPLQPSVTVTATGEPGAIQLVITQGSTFAAVAVVSYVDSPCPGSFSASLTGDMSFESA